MYVPGSRMSPVLMNPMKSLHPFSLHTLQLWPCFGLPFTPYPPVPVFMPGDVP